MKHVKISVLTLVLVVAFSCLTANARASLYLSDYLAILSEGHDSGELIISFSVDATGKMDQVGINKIVLYRTDGNETITIFGSTRNGLIEANTYETSGDYTFTGLTSGAYYYAVVTVFAKDASGSDARAITTKTMQAP